MDERDWLAQRLEGCTMRAEGEAVRHEKPASTLNIGGEPIDNGDLREGG